MGLVENGSEAVWTDTTAGLFFIKKMANQRRLKL
jgi:hypothetical protein